MYLWKSNICSHKLDVQEANVSVSRFYRIRDYSLDAGVRMDGIPALDLWGVEIQTKRIWSEFCDRHSGTFSRLAMPKIREGTQLPTCFEGLSCTSFTACNAD